MTTQDRPSARAVIGDGRAVIGIEFGSTRIKAVLVDPDGAVLAGGSHAWENQSVGGLWTYSLEDVWAGLQASVSDLFRDAEQRHGARPTRLAALGVSAMMHGYLAFDVDGELLVPFRTWRNTTTRAAAEKLTELFGRNIPLRWSVAHHYEAVLRGEPHVARVDHLTTLAGYVHWRLTGRKVLGVGDASGMFPLDPQARDYDSRLLAMYDELLTDRHPGMSLRPLLPQALTAGEEAGRLTAEGAALLDPTGTLEPGVPMCPPEGDAGTGMVATNAIAPRTGNVSVGTSIFAMAVLERPPSRMHPEIDLVTTPVGDLVAMVHCNNGASELGAWAQVFGRFATALGHPTDPDTVFRTLLVEALAGDADGGGLLAYNYLSGEPITDCVEGRPLLVRTPGSSLTLANFARTQVYSVFSTLSLGMQVLKDEGVELDVMVAHGGLFRTEGVTQRILAAAIGIPVAVGEGAGEGGAWGIALLATYRAAGRGESLSEHLTRRVFSGPRPVTLQPDPEDVRGFTAFLTTFRAGLAVERTAGALL